MIYKAPKSIKNQGAYIQCVSKMSKVWLDLALTHIHQFLQLSVNVIRRD